MTKPIVFNYQDYEDLKEENEKLKAEITNLKIRCRIAEADRTKSEWTPVNERLPEEDGLYLTTSTKWGTREVFTEIFYEDEWLWTDGIIAWMPIPAPYEGGK